MRHILLALISFLPGAALAEAYPTMETVRMVVTCMAAMGEQNEENLITCSCKHDVLQDQLTFKEYEEGNLMERYRQMPGEKGGIFRDNELGEGYLKKITAARQLADAQCPMVKKIRIQRDADYKVIME